MPSPSVFYCCSHGTITKRVFLSRETLSPQRNTLFWLYACQFLQLEIVSVTVAGIVLAVVLRTVLAAVLAAVSGAVLRTVLAVVLRAVLRIVAAAVLAAVILSVIVEVISVVHFFTS